VNRLTDVIAFIELIDYILHLMMITVLRRIVVAITLSKLHKFTKNLIAYVFFVVYYSLLNAFNYLLSLQLEMQILLKNSLSVT
jgi:hypothetical protein